MNPQIHQHAPEPPDLQSPSIPSSISSPSQQVFQEAASSPGRIFTDLFSGYDSPLSSEILSRGGQVVRVDILISPEMDILSDDFTEQLLRFCASGKSAYIACSPCCGEYSRLKLRPGPGPKPLRTPEYLGGVPGPHSEETNRLAEQFSSAFSWGTVLTGGIHFRISWSFGTASQRHVLGGRNRSDLG